MLARTRALTVATSLLIGAGVVFAPLSASAEDTPALQPLLDFVPSDFAAEAATLPQELVVALAEDVELTPEEYLAQGAAATQAVAAVEALQASGIGVLGSRLDGLELVVNVSTEAEAEVVESIGASAEFGEPVPGWSDEGLTFQSAADVYDGQGWVWSPNNFTTSYLQCSVGFTGFALPGGAKEFATAGHCTKDMVASARIYNQTAPGKAGSFGDTLGTKVASTTFFGSGRDVGRVATGASNTQKASVLNWGGARSAPLSSAPKVITGDASPIIGATLCKSGSRTGWACGPVVDVDFSATVDGSFTVNSVVAQLCVLPGDSGGVGMIGTKAAGITSWTTASTATSGNVCTDTTAIYGGFFQMVSTGGQQSVATAYGSTWEMAATVSAPTITSIASSGGADTAISGNVPNYGRNYKVDIFLNGSSTVFASANVNASNGTWTATLPTLPVGIHTFQAVARYGTFSKSPATSGTVKRITVERIAGADRFATSAAVAAKFPGSTDRVYIASGLNYPDALSAAPVAAINDAPLLLVNPATLPASIKAALQAINPSEVVLLGGTPSVSTTVKNQIAASLPSAEITRIAGADRYETSRLVSASGFPSGSNASYIATGANFPDALSGGAAAAKRNAPVVLVNGAATTIDTPTRNLLVSLGVDVAYIAGGTPSVSSGIQTAIDGISGVSVQRFSGADRYSTSQLINSNAFPTSSQAYLAVGTGFADALSGAALAGMQNAPLFVVPGNCVPAATLQAMDTMGITKVTLLGSVASLDNNVANLKTC
jgi:putative cell wall-binding protein